MSKVETQPVATKELMIEREHQRTSADLVMVKATGEKISIAAKEKQFAELLARNLQPRDEDYYLEGELFNWIRQAHNMTVKPG